MPGGRRTHDYVWTDGKPPRAWVICGLLLLVFVGFWILLLVNGDRFESPVRDRFHSLAVMHDSRVVFYPAALFWFVNYGLFVIMGWMFILGVVMAIKRKAVPRRD